MTDENWLESQRRVEIVLRALPDTDTTITGGKLGSWYVVAEYEFEDHASLVRLHGTGSVKQSGWRSLGLLTYAHEAERQDNFDYEEDDE
ncbi:MAG: hypothetical protein QOF18_1104 [Frankiaceae bacterium]|nr:hypothetical protein [Frankiaceae bacterium]